uniref:Peptidyl-prolyl cis-trans isomerase n=1 Tax=Compsopogon caeruleus TaxID=31354 RepID=A0A6T6BYZ8_9RHOD|mmetsp:Transcript_2523/g.4355  ORF Transcript_2523/g.4355 Transcript_2523/m.4355 type:complete len:274 (+) Transcript_2523:66-887(+)
MEVGGSPTWSEPNGPPSPDLTSHAELPEKLRPKNIFEIPVWMGEPDRFCGLVVEWNNEPVHVLPFQKGYMIFGRDPAVSNTFVGHPSVSRQHAAIVWSREDRLAYLIDLESENGTYIDDIQIPLNEPVKLLPGHRISFASCFRRYVFIDQYDRVVKELRKSRPTVRVRHILVKHAESGRPSSWRGETITRTRDEARAQIQSYRRQILEKQEDFGRIASEVSDCTSAKRGGDLGPIFPGQNKAAFEEIAFRLNVGEVSEPVETLSGFHIILREG